VGWLMWGQCPPASSMVRVAVGRVSIR
jgi:hypothetical protein